MHRSLNVPHSRYLRTHGPVRIVLVLLLTAGTQFPHGVTAAAPDAYDALAHLSRDYVIATTSMTATHNWSARFDQLLSEAGAVRHLGTDWSPRDPRWQQARHALLDRVSMVHTALVKQGKLDAIIAREYRRAFTPDDARNLAHLLAGPAGPAYLRQQGAMHFIVTNMASGRNAPKPGSPDWLKQMSELQNEFNAGFKGPAPHAGDASSRDALARSPAAGKLGRAFTVSARSFETQVDGAVNLMLFDQRDAINRDIDKAIAARR